LGIWDAVAAIGWQRFFPDWACDKHFAPSVRYARRLQSVDEGRKDFKRVPLGGSLTVNWSGRDDEPDRFDQIWLVGNHADTGGRYPACDGMMHDECMVGIGGTRWARAVRDVPDEATLHETGLWASCTPKRT